MEQIGSYLVFSQHLCFVMRDYIRTGDITKYDARSDDIMARSDDIMARSCDIMARSCDITKYDIRSCDNKI